MAGAGDLDKRDTQERGGVPPGAYRVDGVMSAPSNERRDADALHRRDGDALDAVAEHRRERRGGAADAERPLPVFDERRRERRRARPPGAAQALAEEPVPVGRDPVRAREPGRQEEMREPGAGVASRERVAVE